MDTILTLEGEIGRENLSTQAKKRIKTYHSLKKQLSNLENAYRDAEESEKPNYEDELSELNNYIEGFTKSTITFLKDELDDLKAKQKAKEEKVRKAQEEAERKKKEAQENADGNNNTLDNKDDKKKGSGTGFWTAVGLGVLTLGAFTFFKNRK